MAVVLTPSWSASMSVLIAGWDRMAARMADRLSPNFSPNSSPNPGWVIPLASGATSFSYARSGKVNIRPPCRVMNSIEVLRRRLRCMAIYVPYELRPWSGG